MGNTPNSQKYSLGASIFTQHQLNFYQVYSATSSGGSAQLPNPVITTPGTSTNGQIPTVPVQLVPNNLPIPNVFSNYTSDQSGGSINVGRRLNDYVTAKLGVDVERISTNVTVPFPYFVSGNTTVLNGIISTPFGSQTAQNSLGINAPSIANTVNGVGYNLRSLTAGFQIDTRDDVFNPRHGANVSLSEEVALPQLGSNFSYTLTTFDGAQFYPVLKNSALGIHLQVGSSTGALPVTKLFVYSDQQLRGYSQVFYGTDAILGQAELRYPLTKDRKLNLALFTDYGALRIRGAQPLLDSFGNVMVNYNDWLYHADAGVGIRFDLPQLGFRSIRIDFAKGAVGTHTSFGIGQSF